MDGAQHHTGGAAKVVTVTEFEHLGGYANVQDWCGLPALIRIPQPREPSSAPRQLVKRGEESHSACAS